MPVMKRTLAGMGAALAIGTAVAAAGPLAAQATTPTTLSAQERAGLVFSREEERLAHDLYQYFGQRYDATIFDRIAASEQRHFDAVGSLLSDYGVADPSTGAVSGRYADPALQALFDQWQQQGSSSLAAALQVGLELEQRDIADLQRLQSQTDNADIDRVYQRLEQGSTHHENAFTRAATGSAPTRPDATRPGRHGLHRAGQSAS